MEEQGTNRGIGGFLAGTIAIAAAALWRAWQRNSRKQAFEEPRYMPNELLLSFTSPPGEPLPADDERVKTLLRRVTAIVGGCSLEPITKQAPAAQDKAPEGAPAPRQAWEESAPQAPAGAPLREQPAARPPLQPPLTLRLFAPPPQSVLPARAHIKQVVDRVNSQLDQLQYGGVAVSSAIPNWILSSGGSGGASGGHSGPGTLPDPAPGGGWEITVQDPAGRPPEMTGAAKATLDGRQVVVAVIDSSPGLMALKTAAAKPSYQGNKLMQHLATSPAITDWNRFTPPADVPAHNFRTEPDHGLFVAGIINSVAPHAQIHLLRVLDDSGFTRTDVLFDALDYCLKLAHRGHRVVVNLSMYLLIPPEDEIWEDWFGPLVRYLAFRPGRKAELLEALDEEIERRITLLLDAGVVVVAAAGNDGLDPLRRPRTGRAAAGRHPQPRLPADYDPVLCVVATDRNGWLAAYSNGSDVPLTGNCVACYGGQGVLVDRVIGNQVGPERVAVVPPGPQPRDGVVGLWTQRDVPANDGPKPNETGWAYWSGTSFATPMISGIAANLLARNELERSGNPNVSPLTPREVIDRIAKMGKPAPDPAVGCPYLEISQQP